MKLELETCWNGCMDNSSGLTLTPYSTSISPVYDPILSMLVKYAWLVKEVPVKFASSNGIQAITVCSVAWHHPLALWHIYLKLHYGKYFMFCSANAWHVPMTYDVRYKCTFHPATTCAPCRWGYQSPHKYIYFSISVWPSIPTCSQLALLHAHTFSSTFLQLPLRQLNQEIQTSQCLTQLHALRTHAACM